MWMTDIGSVLFRPSQNGTATSQTATTNSSGLISWFGSAYRGYVGSFRFRIQYNPTTNMVGVVTIAPYDNLAHDRVRQGVVQVRYDVPEAATTGLSTSFNQYRGAPQECFSAAFSPDVWDRYPSPSDPQRTVLGPNLASLAASFSRPKGPAITSSETFFIQQDNGTRVTTGMPFTYSDLGANYLNIEVPYVTPFNFLFTILGGGSVREDLPRQFVSVGSLFVIPPQPRRALISALDPVLTTQLSVPVMANGSFKIWVSCADEFRFGVYLGPPIVSLLTTNVGFDSYLVA